MQIKYYTKSGSVYIRTVDAAGDAWQKLDKAGRHFPLAGAMHLSRRRLQALITDYPVTALDSTACFGEGVAKEFFDDAKREGGVELLPETEDSTIFFLIDRGLGQYGIGYSTRVEKIEKSDAGQSHAAAKAS